MIVWETAPFFAEIIVSRGSSLQNRLYLRQIVVELVETNNCYNIHQCLVQIYDGWLINKWVLAFFLSLYPFKFLNIYIGRFPWKCEYWSLHWCNPPKLRAPFDPYGRFYYFWGVPRPFRYSFLATIEDNSWNRNFLLFR